MCEKLAFFDFFESFVPPRNLRLLLHDAVIVGGALLLFAALYMLVEHIYLLTKKGESEA